jgi:hypothetical protein
LSDRTLIAENRCAAFFVSNVSPETRIGTAPCASVGGRYRFSQGVVLDAVSTSDLARSRVGIVNENNGK